MSARVTPTVLRGRVLKGFRDYLPDTMLPKQRMLDRVAQVFESFGFAPLATPALEYSEILVGKYGEEGDKLLYRFTDNGGRDVALRYDLTVPLARVAGMNKHLPRPFKRYQIAPVWRAEKPGRGRFREFLQCDIDIVGSDDLMADAECMAVGAAVLDALGVQRYVLRFNNRKLLTALLERLGIPEGEAAMAVLRTVDKLPKIGEAGVRAALADENHLAAPTIDALFEFLRLDPSQLAAWAGDHAVGRRGAEEVREVLELAEALGIADRVEVDLSIARGLDYYTGTIYETFLRDLEEIGSVMSGGRYDNLLGMFAGENIPAVGISLGVDRLFSALTELKLVEAEGSPTRVLVTCFSPSTRADSYRIAAELRAAGVPSETFLGTPRMGKQIKYADQRRIPLVVVAGPDELARGQVTLKILATGAQETVERASLTRRVQQALAQG